jgi:hypothetical protein
VHKQTTTEQPFRSLFVSVGERARKGEGEAKTVLSSFLPKLASVSVIYSLFFMRFSFLVSLTKLTLDSENVRGGKNR